MSKNRYIKFLYDVPSVFCDARNRDKYISHVVGDECPSDHLLQENVLPFPKPIEGMVRWFRYVPKDGIMKRELVWCPPPKIYSKTKICIILTQRGLWDKLETWMKENTVVEEGLGLTVYQAFMSAELSSDHPLFDKYLAVAMNVLGIDEAEAYEILSQCEADS